MSRTEVQHSRDMLPCLNIYQMPTLIPQLAHYLRRFQTYWTHHRFSKISKLLYRTGEIKNFSKFSRVFDNVEIVHYGFKTIRGDVRASVVQANSFSE